MASTDDLIVSSKYYDLDDILAQHTNIPCTIMNTIDKDFFPLIGLSENVVIDPKGLKAEVPLWMLRTIKEHCQIILPKAYNAAVQNVLLSNASSANLERLQQYFYFVGMHLADVLEREDGQALSDCLVQTLVQRVGDVVCKGLQGHTKPEKFDNMEKELFQNILVWRKEIMSWVQGGKPISNKRKHD
ncbi:unnamed protein product [Auanema sp. JU1783]|nr:unnamed protein product [Auanema sp. JU1783]